MQKNIYIKPTTSKIPRIIYPKLHISAVKMHINSSEETLRKCLHEIGLDDYYSDFAECCGIVIADYCPQEDDGSIELIFSEGNNKSIAYISRETFCENADDLPEFTRALDRFNTLKRDIISMMALMPNITELELERFGDFAIVPFDKLPNLAKVSLYSCTGNNVGELAKSHAADIYLYDCDINQETLQVLMNAEKKIIDVDDIIYREDLGYLF